MRVRRGRPSAAASASASASCPPPWRRNPDHPPYAEMVQVALRGLAEDGGSPESAISAYIVAAYPGIPPGHPKLLPYYLAKLVAAGELRSLPNGRFLLPHNPSPNPNPNPTAHLPRRRGRPPKHSRDPPPDGQTVRQNEAKPRPRLILRLRRTGPAADGGAAAAGSPSFGWCCLRDGGGGGGALLSPALEANEEPISPAPLNDMVSKQEHSPYLSEERHGFEREEQLPVTGEPEDEELLAMVPLAPELLPVSEERLDLERVPKSPLAITNYDTEKVSSEHNVEQQSPPVAALTPAELGSSSDRRKGEASKKKRRLWYEH